MAGANAIQILRGNNIGSSSQILLPGQPVYDMETGYLRIGDGGTIASTQPIRAYYANSAGSANSATYANSLTSTLSISDGGTAATNARMAMKNLIMNVATSTNPGDGEYLVFATSSTSYRYNYGYIKNDILSEVSVDIPGTIDHANTADIAYSVSGSNVSGSVANAGYADEAHSVSSKLYFNGSGTNVGWNGASTDVIYVPTTMGSIGQVWGVASNGRAAWIDQAEAPESGLYKRTLMFHIGNVPLRFWDMETANFESHTSSTDLTVGTVVYTRSNACITSSNISAYFDSASPAMIMGIIGNSSYDYHGSCYIVGTPSSSQIGVSGVIHRCNVSNNECAVAPFEIFSGYSLSVSTDSMP